MIEYNFDIVKIVQVVNFLLKLNEYSINYTKLLKLLYITDRKALNNWNVTITKDTYANIPKGPILSKVYDLIRKRGHSEYQKIWDCYFKKHGNKLISNIENKLEDDKLSDREIQLLKTLNEKYKNYSYGDMIDEVHELPEWKENYNILKKESPWKKSFPLTINEILRKLGRADNEIKELEEDNAVYLEEMRLFNNCV